MRKTLYFSVASYILWDRSERERVHRTDLVGIHVIMPGKESYSDEVPQGKVAALSKS